MSLACQLVYRRSHSLAAAVAFVFLALALGACSGSKEAFTKQEQENMFKELLGFPPPKEVSEIKYKEVYNRHLMNGAWGRWMRFTAPEEVFLKAVKDRSFKETGFTTDLKSAAAPDWWPNVDQSQITLFSRSHEDTKENEGYSFKEYIWYDSASQTVFFYKHYWG
jgi:hypothetical protein